MGKVTIEDFLKQTIINAALDFGQVEIFYNACNENHKPIAGNNVTGLRKINDWSKVKPMIDDITTKSVTYFGD